MGVFEDLAGHPGHPQAVGVVRPGYAEIINQGETMNDPTRADHAKAEAPTRRASLNEAIDALSDALTNPLVQRIVADGLGRYLDGQGVDHVLATVRLLETPHRQADANVPPQATAVSPGYLEQLRQQGADIPPMPPVLSGFPPAAPQFTPNGEQDGQAAT